MFDPKRYLAVAERFAALATSDSPDDVKELTGSLEMANEASQADQLDMLLALLRYAVSNTAPDWQVYRTPVQMAEVPAGGCYFAVVPAGTSPETKDDTTLLEVVPGLRLFRFERHTGIEQNCSLVQAVEPDEWARRVENHRRHEAEQSFDNMCGTYMRQLAASAYAILERHVARQVTPSPHVVRHMVALKAAVQRAGEARTFAELVSTSGDFDRAMNLVLLLAIALDIKPSKLLADAEAQTEELLR